jgi:hypothetical protein
MRYGLWGRKKVRGGIIVEGPDQMYGMCDIAPNATRDSRADLWIFPPVRQANQPFVARSIAFYDQVGNKHSLKKRRLVTSDLLTAGLKRQNTLSRTKRVDLTLKSDSDEVFISYTQAFISSERAAIEALLTPLRPWNGLD